MSGESQQSLTAPKALATLQLLLASGGEVCMERVPELRAAPGDAPGHGGRLGSWWAQRDSNQERSSDMPGKKVVALSKQQWVKNLGLIQAGQTFTNNDFACLCSFVNASFG